MINPKNKTRRQLDNMIEIQAHSLFQSCNNIFNESNTRVIQKFKKLTESRHDKRRWQFMAGVIITDLINEVRQAWKGSDNEDFNRYVQASINHLTSRETVLANTIRASNANQEKLQGQIDMIIMDELKYPVLSSYYNYIVAEITVKGHILSTFYETYEQNKVNTVNVAQVFNQNRFDRVEARDVRVAKVKVVDGNSLHVYLVGHVRLATSKVYKVHSVDFYSNFTFTPVRHEYVGKHYLVYNNQTHCAKVIDPTNDEAIDVQCNEPNFVDPELQLWRKTPVAPGETIHSKMIDAWPYFIISCWRNTLYIVKGDSPKFERTKCPNYVFKLNSQYSFKTNDNLVHHESKSVQLAASTIKYVFDVQNIHLPDFKLSHEVFDDNLKVSNQLLKKYQNMTEESIATTVAGHSITWKSAAHYSLLS